MALDQPANFRDFDDFHDEPEVAAKVEAQEKPKVTLVGNLVLCFYVASFCYEIPLVYVSNFYKGNPYLFDVATICLTGYWLMSGRSRGWTLKYDNLMLQPWLALVGIIIFCTFVSVAWIPLSPYLQGVWYCLKYIEGTIGILIVLSAPIDERIKRRMLWVALLGGTLVSAVATLQVLGIISTERVIPKGTEILIEGYGIFSTLGVTYFHTGFFGVISAMVGLTLYTSSRGFARIVAGLLAAFVTVPAIVSGSRAAFFGLIIALAFLGVGPVFRKQFRTYFMAGILGFAINAVYAQSYTKERTERYGVQESVETRLLHGPHTLKLTWDTHGPRLLIFGGGFGAVPIRRPDGTMQYRTGFGNHNIHFFGLEQTGIVGFGIMIWLWVRLGTTLGRRRTPPGMNLLDDSFRQAMFAFFVSMILVGWTGTSFWIQHGNEHFCIYEMLLFGLALYPTGGAQTAKVEPVPVHEFSPFHQPLTEPAGPGFR